MPARCPLYPRKRTLETTSRAKWLRQLGIFAAIRRASSFVSGLAADRRPGSSSKQASCSSTDHGGGKRRLGIGGTNNQLIGTLGYVADPKVVLTCRCPTVILFRPRCVMDSKRKVEVFSAGCAFCHEVIDVVRREAGSSSQIIVHNMTDARSLVRAEQFGIRSVPAVVIDGKLSPCCTGSVDIQALKNELKKGS